MKKTLSTITLAAILTFGTTIASARDGVVYSGRVANTENTCTQVDKGGVVYSGIVEIIYQLTGILVADRSAPCAEQSRGGVVYSG